jgi:hypothetical protein
MAIDLIVLGSREFDHGYSIRLSVCYSQGPRKIQTLRAEEDFISHCTIHLKALFARAANGYCGNSFGERR